MLACGHRKTHLPCWQAQQLANVVCDELVERTVPTCLHTVQVHCHVDVSASDFVCTAKCGASLACGHRCKKHCNECVAQGYHGNVREDHGQCQQQCDRNYTTCNHRCVSTCHGQEECPPCDARCDIRCSHSQCSKKCHEPCAPCAEEHCASSCPHSTCTMPCAAPCDRLPCSKRCEKVLSCGHRCM